MTEQIKELIRRLKNGITEYYSFFKDSKQAFTKLDDNYKEIYRVDFIANNEFINEVLEYEKNDIEKLFVTRWEDVDGKKVFWIEKSDYIVRKGMNLELIETNGDVKFFKDKKGKQYQQIGNEKPFKVTNGKIQYRKIRQLNGNTIKYNTNGCYGFSVWKGNRNLEDRIWTIADAERIATEI